MPMGWVDSLSHGAVIIRPGHLSFSLGYPREGPFVWVAWGLLTNPLTDSFLPYYKRMPMQSCIICIIFLLATGSILAKDIEHKAWSRSSRSVFLAGN
jgi:hypothetical protein